MLSSPESDFLSGIDIDCNDKKSFQSKCNCHTVQIDVNSRYPVHVHVVMLDYRLKDPGSALAEVTGLWFKERY